MGRRPAQFIEVILAKRRLFFWICNYRVRKRSNHVGFIPFNKMLENHPRLNSDSGPSSRSLAITYLFPSTWRYTALIRAALSFSVALAQFSLEGVLVKRSMPR